MSKIGKIEIMGWTENDVLRLEEQDEGSLMMEITPLELGQKSARIFLDEAGRKRLMIFLTKNFKEDIHKWFSELASVQPIINLYRECDTCRFIEEITCQEPCCICENYDKWEEKAKV